MKNLLIISCCLALFSCKTTESAQENKTKTKDEKLAVIELRAGQNSGFTQAVNKVIKNQEELNEVWTVLFANYMKKEEAPEVDFGENMLLLVAAGERNSGGYTIKVSSATLTAENMKVAVVSTSPGKNCMTTEAITYPFQLVQVARSNKAVVFDTTEKIIDCESE